MSIFESGILSFLFGVTVDDGLARGAANRRGGSHDSDSVFGRTFFPASGLLADRSRPGANIEARLRFNPRSGRVALIDFFWNWTSCLFSSGVRWTMVWRGAHFNLRSGRVALIAFFDWTACLFSSGGSVDDGLARGALQPAFWVRCIDCFFFSFSFSFQDRLLIVSWEFLFIGFLEIV